ncbi:hypothetical protein CVT24_005951 [Panaeolus cyanescens]|uniref:DUF7918 domain-containing protein n=1 Tax=Panaeolus cyanescens TaxID=181874 RepID=A0A409V8Z9_9AGAR|nr:hypothetical protein CVT24_005951 [Panaeolus cyanescens]
MLTHRGFSAWIVSEGCTIPEYLVAVDEATHRVSCWIPATVGESFSIFWQDHNGGVDTSAFITLDGVTVPGRFLFGDGMASRSGVRVSKTTERPFVFASILEDANSSSSSAPVNKEIGMITLKIKRVKRVTIRPANTIQELPSTTALGKRKAGDVRIEFGADEQPLEEQASTTWGTVPYDEIGPGQSSSYVSFLFRYRTREFLEAQGIITESVRKTLPTNHRQPQLTEVQQRRSFTNPPPAKPAAEFTPEPESERTTSPVKKPRLGNGASRSLHPSLNNPRSQPTELRRATSSSTSSSSTSVAAHNPYGIFYYQRSLSSPTQPLNSHESSANVLSNLNNSEADHATEPSTDSETCTP